MLGWADLVNKVYIHYSNWICVVYKMRGYFTSAQKEFNLF